jgi:SH3-like domain-containing protein
MASRRVPRLGLLARIGFGGLISAIVLVAVVTLDIRFVSDQEEIALADAALPSAPQTVAPALPPARPKMALVDAQRDAEVMPEEDRGPSIEDLLGPSDARAADVTGSLPTQDPAPVGLGPVSGLPMPRFVSLKSDRINVRQGPTRDQKVSFIFQKSGLPVEIIAEFENWRRIRDSEGAEGWVMQSMLSGRRTALIAPWSKEATLALKSRADEASPAVALLQPGVLATIQACAADWCRISGSGFDGWIEQQKLWGAYPGEEID